MCFVHMQNADFGQILCRHASTKRDLTTDCRKLGIKRCARLERKKLMKKRVAICGGRGFCTGGGGGGGQYDPPPPPQLE